MKNEIKQALTKMPFLTFLRGIQPEEWCEIGEVLYSSGFTVIEVSLNSSDPFLTIGMLAKVVSGRTFVGVGKVTKIKQLEKLCDSGGQLVIMSHTYRELIKEAKRLKLDFITSVSTTSEAFQTLEAELMH